MPQNFLAQGHLCQRWRLSIEIAENYQFTVAGRSPPLSRLLYVIRKRTQVLQEACFSRGATRGHPSLVLLSNLITQLFKARRGPSIVDIPPEPYPTDTRKYLIIPGLWPEIYPPTATLWDVLQAHMSFIPPQPAVVHPSSLYSCCHSPVITFQIELQFMPPWSPRH